MTKKQEKILNILLFVQYILINITSIYHLNDNYQQIISTILLIIGYFLNPRKGQNEDNN